MAYKGAYKGQLDDIFAFLIFDIYKNNDQKSINRIVKELAEKHDLPVGGSFHNICKDATDNNYAFKENDGYITLVNNCAEILMELPVLNASAVKVVAEKLVEKMRIQKVDQLKEFLTKEIHPSNYDKASVELRISRGTEKMYKVFQKAIQIQAQFRDQNAQAFVPNLPSPRLSRSSSLSRIQTVRAQQTSQGSGLYSAPRNIQMLSLNASLPSLPISQGSGLDSAPRNIQMLSLNASLPSLPTSQGSGLYSAPRNTKRLRIVPIASLPSMVSTSQGSSLNSVAHDITLSRNASLPSLLTDQGSGVYSVAGNAKRLRLVLKTSQPHQQAIQTSQVSGTQPLAQAQPRV